MADVVKETVPEVAESDRVRGIGAIAAVLGVCEKKAKRLAHPRYGTKRLPLYLDHIGYWSVADQLTAWMKAQQRVYGAPESDRAA